MTWTLEPSGAEEHSRAAEPVLVLLGIQASLVSQFVADPILAGCWLFIMNLPKKSGFRAGKNLAMRRDTPLRDEQHGSEYPGLM